MKTNSVQGFIVSANYDSVSGPSLLVSIERDDKVRFYDDISDASAARVARILAQWQVGNPFLDRARTKKAIRVWEARHE